MPVALKVKDIQTRNPARGSLGSVAWLSPVGGLSGPKLPGHHNFILSNPVPNCVLKSYQFSEFIQPPGLRLF